VTWIVAHTQVGLVDMTWLEPGWAQFLVAFLVLDFVRYWVHYADHRVPWLWTFHRVHHSSEYLDASAGLRMHLVDFCQLSAIPIVLFGLLMDATTFQPWVISAAMGVGIVFDCLQHANISMDMTKPHNKAWNLLLNNPHFHSWHHTRDGSLCDGNYSNTLIIWDRIFGTEVTQPKPPELYGLDDSQAIENSLLGWQLLRPHARQERYLASNAES
jgi:sterol desaturase/sphingolipid hydroxylase (fatty acid hydroxylase superfamily)